MHIDIKEYEKFWEDLLPIEFDVKLNHKVKKVLRVKPKTQRVTIRKSEAKPVQDTILGSSIFHVLRSGDRKVSVEWMRKGKRREDSIHFTTKEQAQRFEESLVLVRASKSREELRQLTESITITTATWNMGDTEPPHTLMSLLYDNEEGEKVKTTDIYVMAVQECSHKPPEGEGKSTSSHMIAVIQRTLGDDFCLLRDTSLWTTRLFVFVRASLEKQVTRLESSREATGIANIVRNKGAVSVSFAIHQTSFCFVGSHLAAHQERVDDRNDDFEEIMKGLNLGESHFAIDTQFTHVFWMGDLNYRIDLPRDEVIQLIEREDWTTLQKADQLLREKRNARVFHHWKEGPLNFRPTYRFSRGTNEYDSDLGRIPSWCDRVLYRSLPVDEEFIEQQSYGSIDSIRTSDHHPVYATFVVEALKTNVLHPPQMIGLKITNLHGVNLVAKDWDGTSDPFVQFHGTFLEKRQRTKIIKNTLNPVWDDEDVPLLIPFITNAYLERCYLHFLVLDHDRITHEDNMGQGVIPLVGIFRANNPIAFRIEVILKGAPAGYLCGQIQLVQVPL